MNMRVTSIQARIASGSRPLVIRRNDQSWMPPVCPPAFYPAVGKANVVSALPTASPYPIVPVPAIVIPDAPAAAWTAEPEAGSDLSIYSIGKLLQAPGGAAWMFDGKKNASPLTDPAQVQAGPEAVLKTDRTSKNARVTASRKGGEAVRAAAFVKENSGGSYWDDERTKLYPEVNGGNNGLFAYLLSGQDAVTVAAIASAFQRRLIAFDPLKQALIAVRNSEDEIGFYVAILDRDTGEVAPVGGEMKLHEMGDSIDAEQFARLFPGQEYAYDGYDVLNPLFNRGTDLGIGNKTRGPGRWEY